MLEVKEALKVFGEGEARVVALDKVSLRVNRGDYIAVMGPSGSGKSTLLNIIGGLDRLTGGEVLLDGRRIDNLDENSLVEIRRRKITYVFQQYHLLPSLTALENIYMPLLFGGANGHSLDKAMEFLKMVGLERRARHKPGQLSGGEQQRVAIARAIVHDPSLILADEPTGNMDQKTGEDIMEVFAKLNAEGRGIVMVTHSPEVAKHAKSIVYLQDGRIVERVERSKVGDNK